MAYLHCFPITWEKSARFVKILQNRGILVTVKTLEILQLGYFVLMSVILINQLQVGCMLTLLPTFRMLLVTGMCYGMGIEMCINGYKIWKP